MHELADDLGRRLKAARRTLVTAESCTGGWVAQAVTAIAGSSEWFERGLRHLFERMPSASCSASPRTR